LRPTDAPPKTDVHFQREEARRDTVEVIRYVDES
jgi:hypothetical protein